MRQTIEKVSKWMGAVICLAGVMLLAVPALADVGRSPLHGTKLSKPVALAAYQQPELSGVVTNADGVPLPNIEIYAYPVPEYSGQFINSSVSSTGSDGRFTFADIEDSPTILRFRDNDFHFVQEYYSDVYAQADATTFRINPVAPVEINAMLDVGGSVSGNLWRPDWDTSLRPQLQLFKKVDPNIPDNPYPSPYRNYRRYWNFSTDIRESAGTYRLQGLEPGTYIILATVNGGRHYFNGPRPEDATAFNVALGTETTGINISFLSPTSLDLTEEPAASNWFDKLFFPFISQ